MMMATTSGTAKQRASARCIIWVPYPFPRSLSSPIHRSMVLAIDDLQEADGTPLDFGDQSLAPLRSLEQFHLPLPIIVRDPSDDVWLSCPVLE